MRYEEGLATLFRTRGHRPIELMAMAHVGGLADRVPEWQPAGQDAYERAAPGVFEALRSGDVDAIEAEMRKLESMSTRGSLTSAEALDIYLGQFVKTLILVGRAELLPVLHERSLQRHGEERKSLFTATATLALAAAGEWSELVRILEHAARESGDIDIPCSFEMQIWRYAYLHRQVKTVMPVLAETPFSADKKHLVEYRRWLLKTYQIRAGVTSAWVPVIDNEADQPAGYEEAAAMQIAALSHEASAADYVRDLRRAVSSRAVEIIHVDRNIAVEWSNLPQAFWTAEAQIAARRKDHQAAATLAQVRTANVLEDPASTVIDALLDESDWRAAARILEAHDSRGRPVPAGFDDTRATDYIVQHIRLALAAAREGDDDAAATFLARAKAVDQAKVERDDGTTSHGAFLWIETLLAGLAEAKLPRKHLYVLAPAFPSSS